MYYPLSSYKIIPAYIDVTVVAGERMYAVDRDTASISNLADLETGAASLSALWRLGHSVGVMLSVSRSQFKIPSSYNTTHYALKSAWLGLILHW